jgi:hypothetical protein
MEDGRAIFKNVSKFTRAPYLVIEKIKSRHSRGPSLKIYLKNVSRIRKKTFYLQFCMGTPEGMGTLQAEYKILKKIIGTQNLSIKTKNF